MSFIFRAATIADECPPWSPVPYARDRVLREFWKSEDILKTSIFVTVARYAAMQWSVIGPPLLREVAHDTLNMVEDGKGMQALISKVELDCLTQDNGGWVNIIRSENSSDSPMVSLKHLDSSRCRRTGVYDQPMVYWDALDAPHVMQDYQCEDFVDFPAPEDRAYGSQMCAVSRIIEDARYIRDTAIFTHEKVSGRNPRAIHFVGGVSGKSVRKALEDHKRLSEAKSQFYVDPPIIPGNDPTATVSKVTLEMASLYDGFSEDSAKRWYYQAVANALGVDSQDLIPLPGGNLGTSQQSNNLSMKGNTKGPALFQGSWTHFMNYKGVLPRDATFSYAERDPSLEMAELQMANLRAKNRQIRLGTQVAPGELTPAMARQLAVRDGDLPVEFLAMVGEQPFDLSLFSSGPGGN